MYSLKSTISRSHKMFQNLQCISQFHKASLTKHMLTTAILLIWQLFFQDSAFWNTSCIILHLSIHCQHKKLWSELKTLTLTHFQQQLPLLGQGANIVSRSEWNCDAWLSCASCHFIEQDQKQVITAFKCETFPLSVIYLKWVWFSITACLLIVIQAPCVTLSSAWTMSRM